MFQLPAQLEMDSDQPGTYKKGQSSKAMNQETRAQVSYDMEVDVLIVGAGPTGASLACFLGSYGTNIRNK